MTDIEVPVISGVPASVVALTNGNSPVNWVIPTATDNSDVVSLTSTHGVGVYIFPLGETSVTYTATDPSGNTATHTFTVTVRSKYARRGHSHWEVIWVCAPFMTHLFTPISSSGNPQFQVNLQLWSPNSQCSPKSSSKAAQMKSK